MSTLLYLVRHGETMWNREGRYQGHRDVPLSEAGREQARRLAERLRGVRFDRAYSSDLVRCMETARILLAARDLEATPDPRLREMSYGRWEGLTLEEVSRRHPEEAAAYRRDGVGTRIAEGESLQDVAARVKQFSDELLKDSGLRVLVVTHGGALKALLFVLLGVDLRHRGRFVIDNASLTVVRAGGSGRPRALRVNDVAHLDMPLP